MRGSFSIAIDAFKSICLFLVARYARYTLTAGERREEATTNAFAGTRGHTHVEGKRKAANCHPLLTGPVKRNEQ